MEIDRDIEKNADVEKALIVPVGPSGKIFIQDRRGHKKPDWGWFGGRVEEGETPLEAVIRKTGEELSITITEPDLIYLGSSATQWDEAKVIRYFYLYHTEEIDFDVREGRGGLWLTFDEARPLFDDKDRFDEVVRMIRMHADSRA